jgi:PAS domain S-box-containing protein
MKKNHKLDGFTKDLLDEMPVLFAWYDAKMRLVWANKLLVDSMGESLEKLVGRTCSQIWQMARTKTSDYPITKAKLSKQMVEERIELEDGRIWSVRSSPILNDTGEISAFTELIRDVTELERGNDLLKKYEVQYLSLIEAVNNLAIVVDKDFRIQTIMGRRLKDYPVKPNDLLAEKLKILYPCSEGEKFQEYCQRVFETGESFSVECIYEFNQITRADRIFYFPIYSKNNQFDQVGILCRDITPRKNAEIALQESEKTLKDIIEFLPDATFVIDRQSNVIAWNRAIEQMTGVAKNEMLGKGDYIYSVPFYGERRPILIDLIFAENKDIEKNYVEVKRFGETLVAEVFIPTLYGGKGVYLWGIASPLYNNTGELVGAIESIRDVSERKGAENQLKTALAEKEALLRELYHRTKNNMQMISSMLSLQTDYIDNIQIMDIFKDMENRIRSMALVHQLLYQSRNLSSIDLAEYLNELIGLLLQSYNAHPDLIKITLKAEPITVLIDTAIPCGLIINELVSNSLKYAFPNNRPGEILISVTRPTDNEIMLEISDNGIGAPPGFDPHSQGKLGMQIVIALSEQQLGGKVTLEFEHGFFYQIRFPISQ